MATDLSLLEQVLLLHAAESYVKKLAQPRKTEARELFEPGDRKAVYVKIDGQKVKLGTVELTESNEDNGWEVADHEALMQWIRENCPGAIVHVPQVSEAWLTEVLKNGVIPDTGEVPDGLRKKKASTPQFRPRPTDAATDLLLARGLRSLEPGKGDDD